MIWNKSVSKNTTIFMANLLNLWISIKLIWIKVVGLKKKNNANELQIKKLLKNKVILITGGAGSIGSSLTKTLLDYPVDSIRVFDNNEHALFTSLFACDWPLPREREIKALEVTKTSTVRMAI